MAAIIFICNANMCRSPMAEGILKKRFLQNGFSHVDVASMGIHAQEGNSATEFAITVCREASIDIETHRSRPLDPDELKKSHLIFTMESIQVDFIDLFFPQVSDRIFMLGTWPERKRKKADIPDPVGRSINAYRKTFQHLEERIGFLMPDLLRRYAV